MREKLFVVVDTGYFRRIEMAVSREGATITVTVDYFDYDTPITITPPC